MFHKRNLLYFITAILSFSQYIWATEHFYSSINYHEEYYASIKGQEWYTSWSQNKYVPNLSEITPEYSITGPNNVTIRLPIDLKRIIDEYKSGKPVSLAVSCGDRELPLRAYITSKYNNDSILDDDALHNHFLDKIDYSMIRDNYISIDPYLVVDNINQVQARGAGHINMNANNISHWQELKKFLDHYGVKISQIIFTAGFGDPFVSNRNIDINNEMLTLQKSMLTDNGKLISAYFFQYHHTMMKNRKGLSQGLNMGLYVSLDLYDPVIFADGILRYIFSDNAQLSPTIISIIQKHYQGIDISSVLNNLIYNKVLSKNNVHLEFIYDLSLYYVNIINPGVFELEGELHKTNIFSHSPFEQLKNIAPIYAKYFKNLGLNVEFITNKTTAEAIGIPAIVAQAWHAGQYPYGERDHIALVMTNTNS